MALGYALALALEAAGLAGLIIGLLRLRSESQARADGLRGLLLTGNNHAAGMVRPAATSPVLRQVVVDAAVTDARTACAARTALDRVFDPHPQQSRMAA